MKRRKIIKMLNRAKANPGEQTGIIKVMKEHVRGKFRQGDIEMAIINHSNGNYPTGSAADKIQEAINPQG